MRKLSSLRPAARPPRDNGHHVLHRDQVARLAPAAPRGTSRRPSRADHERAALLAELLDDGVPLAEACRRVATDPRLGFRDWRTGESEPTETRLRVRIARMLARVAPQLVQDARDRALAGLSAVSDDAVAAVSTVTLGDFHRKDAGKARTRLEAARLALEAVGVGGRNGSAATTVNVSVFESVRAKIRAAQVESIRDAP